MPLPYSVSQELNKSLSILNQWQLSDTEKALLVGFAWQKEFDANSGSDVLAQESPEIEERMALIASIDRSLNILYSDTALIRNWLRSSNSHETFNGSTPLTFMCNGSIQSLQSIAALLAAWSAGNY